MDRRAFFRPQDVELDSGRPGAIPGTIAAIRRHGGARRLDVEVGRDGHRIEIELPSQCEGGVGEKIFRASPPLASLSRRGVRRLTHAGGCP